MKKLVADFISVIFHPLLMTSYLYLLLMHFSPVTWSQLGGEAGWQILLVIFVFTCAMPIFSMVVLHFNGFLDSFKMPLLYQRKIPFIFISAFYVFTAITFFYKLNINYSLTLILLTLAFLVLVLTLISMFFKISIHAAAAAGNLGFLLGMQLYYPQDTLFYPIIGVAIALGTIMSARLYLNAHKPSEVYYGALLGLVMCFGSFLLFL